MRWMLLFALLLGSGLVAAFEHTHSAWEGLLKRHVVLLDEGRASRLNYAGMAADREALAAYLAQLSAVDPQEYQGWGRERRLAFLINAYNAFTVELILSNYPGVESIRDLGSLFRSPWKRRFFTLLGEKRHLDNLEQDMIRAAGVFDEPRIHFALNCASIGCPMLRNEAYVGARLEDQLEDAMLRFLSDRDRNYFDATEGTLWVSKIFDWYGEDFADNSPPTSSLKGLFASYADRLVESAEARERLREGDYRIDFLDYNWRLNDTSKPTGN
ncbi:MAG: DUF547 domain-containing protein [Candidatus Thiodiazotropha sp.]